MTDKRKALIERLRSAVATAANDDWCEPLSEKRNRHIARVSAMQDAIDFLTAPEAREALPASEEKHKHNDRSIPCPTCGFVVRKTTRKPFVIEDDLPPQESVGVSADLPMDGSVAWGTKEIKPSDVFSQKKT